MLRLIRNGLRFGAESRILASEAGSVLVCQAGWGAMASVGPVLLLILLPFTYDALYRFLGPPPPLVPHIFLHLKSTLQTPSCYCGRLYLFNGTSTILTKIIMKK